MRGSLVTSSEGTVCFCWSLFVFSVAGRRPGYTEGRHRGTSARGQSASQSSSGFIMDSDEEELSASRSPNDALAYREVSDLWNA